MSSLGPPEPSGTALDVLTFGEAMVSFRSAGPLASGAAVAPGLAGAETNVAIALARLGHRAGWVGRLGADPFGDLALRELRAEGVDVSHVVTDVEAPTGLMFLEQRTADVSRVDYRRAGSAGSRLCPADLTQPLGPSPRILHVTGITPALSVTAREAWAAALDEASGADVLVSLDVNYRARLWDRATARDVLQARAAGADIVIASDDELDLVADGPEAEAVGALLAGGSSYVVVKRGACGASVWTADGRIDAPALPVTAVDTVGAGDAFSAGFLSGLLDGLDAGACLQRGVLLGAWAVSTRGDWQGLPRRAELDLLAMGPGATLR
ncbi:MAG: sugar kinase [Intrasporangium sp.]|uniref:sugar kinase n=1 Tax=Intrasporangium sp. TaxID=1925024 RepID=UPI003F7DEB7C